MKSASQRKKRAMRERTGCEGRPTPISIMKTQNSVKNQSSPSTTSLGSVLAPLAT
jgi:hypothetical protein